MTESETMKRIQMAASDMGARLFRNNVGCLPDPRGGYVTYGLCTGSSDLIGWNPVQITDKHVGTRLPIFTALEVKSARGRVTPEQAHFIAAVRRANGIAAVVRSVEEALVFLR
jgi:hypothetical protein